MSDLIAAHAWEATSFGALAAWSPQLRTAVNLMLEGGAAMAIVWGADYRLLYNERYREILQDKHPGALGATAAEIFPEMWADVRPLFDRAYAGESVVIDDFAISLQRGGVVREACFSGSYNPLRNESGLVEGFLAVVVETTARVRREQARWHIFDTTLSAITDFAYSFDRDGRFIYVNKALLDLWGLKLEQAVGKNFFDLKYPDDLAARLQRQINHVFVHKEVLRDETPYTSPTGVAGYYEYIFSPVFAADGSVVVVAGSTRDITTRKALERELRDVQTRMDAALSAGSIGTWAWDVPSNRVYADPSLARFFSLSEQEANGGPIESYLAKIHSDDRARIAEIFAGLLAQGSRFDAEYRLVGSDGAVRWMAARGSVERDAKGTAVSIPGVVVDITDRKQLEARVADSIHELQGAKAKLEQQAGELEQLVEERTAKLQDTISELESFSYSISHDLRGPLRVMQSFAQALREDCGENLSPIGADYIRRIVAAGDRMDRIIQDVLVYSRIARTDLRLEPVALDEFIPSLLDGYPGFHDAKAEITIVRPLPAVQANRAALTQCIANLLGNAIKFVAPGVRPAVRVSARVDGERVRVSIADNGIGIPKRAHDAIFGVFYRLEPGYEGTGIGLAIVRKAVERMGGGIAVESEPQRGSTFTFDLALAETP